MPVLSVRVINGLTLAIGGRPLPMTNRKARAILAMLAMEASPTIPRERLAAMFWGESSERHARNSLRQTIFEIREALAARDCMVLRATRDELHLVREHVELDLDEIVRAIAAGEVPRSPPDAASEGGWLLTSYDDLSPEFGEWIASARRFAHERLMRAFDTACQDEALPPETRRCLADAALRLDPLREGICRVLMRLAADAGEIGVALRAYAALYDAMGLHLDMEPSDTTQALVAEIKMGRGQASTVPAPLVEPVPSSSPPAAPPGRVPIVAILPFQAAGSDEITRDIAEVVSEDLVRVLASLREPAVISSNSTRHLRAPTTTLSHIGESLGADYLVTGSVRTAGARGRVSVELVQSSSGIVLWSEAYGIDTDRILDGLEHVAASIANALGRRVDAEELRRGLARSTSDLSAYHLVLRARDLIFQMEPATLTQAETALRLAIQRDSSYATAHATYAYLCSLKIFQGWSSDPSSTRVALMEAVNTALRLDPNHARALALLGHNLMMTEHRYDEAEVLVDRAVVLAPNDSDVLITGTPTCAYVGRAEEAVRRATLALCLSPRDPFLFRYEHFCSIAFYAAEDFERAAYWGLRSWRSNPNFTSNLRVTIASLSALGRYEEAKPMVARHHALQPEFRAASVIARYSIRDPEQRETFAKRLSDAGMR
jgi:DNA-binding SARP family transcriptional activator/Tfp pilus assembly protein PilF